MVAVEEHLLLAIMVVADQMTTKQEVPTMEVVLLTTMEIMEETEQEVPTMEVVGEHLAIILQVRRAPQETG